MYFALTFLRAIFSDALNCNGIIFDDILSHISSIEGSRGAGSSRRRYALARGFSSLAVGCLPSLRFARSSSPLVSASRQLARSPFCGAQVVHGLSTESPQDLHHPPAPPQGGGRASHRETKRASQSEALLLTRTSTATAQITLEASAVHGIDGCSVFLRSSTKKLYHDARGLSRVFFCFPCFYMLST